MTESSQQLPLNFKNSESKSFDDFIEGQNLALLDSLKSFIHSNETLFYLWGNSGSGKSHLLQAATIQFPQQKAVIFKPEDLLVRENVALIALFDIICIDQAETIAGHTLLEESLFFWINETRQAHKKIILASQLSTNDKQWQLADLRSRLHSGRTHELKIIDRNNALQIFMRQAEKKGIVVDQKIEKYLSQKCPMNMKFLSQLLQQLDEVTLVEKKQVTIPLLKKILQSILVK